MNRAISNSETYDILLRDTIISDLPIFFEQQLDVGANRMAAFTVKNSADREAFMARWTRILGDESIIIKTIICNGQVAGQVSSYIDKELGMREVSYWIGRAYWGKGIASNALSEFLLGMNKVRPLYAHATKDNIGSQRVLEKCGFARIGENKEFSNVRREEFEG